MVIYYNPSSVPFILCASKNVLVKMHICTGSSELSLVPYAISTLIPFIRVVLSLWKAFTTTVIAPKILKLYLTPLISLGYLYEPSRTKKMVLIARDTCKPLRPYSLDRAFTVSTYIWVIIKKWRNSERQNHKKILSKISFFLKHFY